MRVALVGLGHEFFHELDLVGQVCLTRQTVHLVPHLGVMLLLADPALVEALESRVRFEPVQEFGEFLLGDEVLKSALQHLNTIYAAFVAQFGPHRALVLLQVELAGIKILHLGEYLPDLFRNVQACLRTLFIISHFFPELCEGVVGYKPPVNLLDPLLR